MMVSQMGASMMFIGRLQVGVIILILPTALLSKLFHFTKAYYGRPQAV